MEFFLKMSFENLVREKNFRPLQLGAKSPPMAYTRGLQLAARGPILAREGRTVGPRSRAKMQKKFITFSLKLISLYWQFMYLYLLLRKYWF